MRERAFAEKPPLNTTCVLCTPAIAGGALQCALMRIQISVKHYCRKTFTFICTIKICFGRHNVIRERLSFALQGHEHLTSLTFARQKVLLWSRAWIYVHLLFACVNKDTPTKRALLYSTCMCCGVLSWFRPRSVKPGVGWGEGVEFFKFKAPLRELMGIFSQVNFEFWLFNEA